MKSLWGANCDYSFSGSSSLSGGILLIWDVNVFIKEEEFINSHFVGVKGRWAGVEEQVGLVNIYRPQCSIQKEELYEELHNLLAIDNVKWVVFGDFNAVR